MIMLGRAAAALVAALVLFHTVGARAQASLPSSVTPPILREIGFDQHMGSSLPLDLHFRDERGADVTLGHYLGTKPVVLALVYYGCPMLCLQTLHNLAGSIAELPFRPGTDFDVVAVSFDPHDTPAKAASTKKTILGAPESDADRGWHLLTGGTTEIHQLTSAVGFNYVWDDSLSQFAHPTGLTIVTPDGRISRYLFGIDYRPVDLRLALIDASSRLIASPTNALLLYCYHYDPARGRYGVFVMRLVRTAGAATVLCIGGLILFFVRRERREAH